MTPLTTPIFDFHQVINALTTPLTTPTPTPSLVKTSLKVRFRSTEGQTFYWSIMTAGDSIKCRCANSGMKGQVGGFQNPGVCLQPFPSFLPDPLPALLLAPFVARSLTLVPRSEFAPKPHRNAC